jgi:DNA-binding transcriptional LysR family regulator
MLKRTHLRYFIAVVEAGGFTAAARRLNLTQPTLSASMAELERHVGSPLIVRDRRRIEVTEAGQRLLTLARSIERDFRAAESSLSEKARPHRPLRVGMLGSTPSGWFAALRRHYAGPRPLVLLEGGDADLRRRLGGGQLEAIVTTLRSGDDAAGEIHAEGYAVLLARTHRLAQAALLQPEDLANEVMVARRSCEILSETSDFFTARGIRPHFLMRSANEDRCLALVREGFAVTTGPTSLAVDGIVARPMEGYTFSRSLGVIAGSDDIQQDLVAALGNALQPAVRA